VQLKNAKEDFEHFWKVIGADGDLESALDEWSRKYNSTGSGAKVNRRTRIFRKIARLAKKLPTFIRKA